MALIHCTRKLAVKLTLGSGGPETGPLGSWHASLVRYDRRQCVMFCHDETRYCLFLPGLRAPQLAELGRWHRELFLASLRIEGVADAAIGRAGVALGAARFDAVTDRSVLASMNIALRDLEPYWTSATSWTSIRCSSRAGSTNALPERTACCIGPVAQCGSA